MTAWGFWRLFLASGVFQLRDRVKAWVFTVPGENRQCLELENVQLCCFLQEYCGGRRMKRKRFNLKKHDGITLKPFIVKAFPFHPWCIMHHGICGYFGRGRIGTGSGPQPLLWPYHKYASYSSSELRISNEFGKQVLTLLALNLTVRCKADNFWVHYN